MDESVPGQATVTCKNVTDMRAMFENCSNLTSIDLSTFDTSKVNTMGSMFKNCTSLVSADLSNFNTSRVIKMNGMFYRCKSISSLDLSNFDTSKVTNMDSMFCNCNNLTTIKGVIDMKSCTEECYDMFRGCTSLKNVNIKNPPADFENMSYLSSLQYTIVS